MVLPVNFKANLLHKCREILNAKAAALRDSLTQVTGSMESESKSSMGDKHETSRARMQADETTLRRQLSDVEDQLSELERINISQLESAAFRGSVVETNRGLFFIAVAIGKVFVEDREVMVISPNSPI